MNALQSFQSEDSGATSAVEESRSAHDIYVMTWRKLGLQLTRGHMMELLSKIVTLQVGRNFS